MTGLFLIDYQDNQSQMDIWCVKWKNSGGFS